MSRDVITPETLFARMRPGVGRRGKNSITVEEKTRIVLRALAGEDVACLALEVTRSPVTIHGWVSHYQCGTHEWHGHPGGTLAVFDGGAA